MRLIYVKADYAFVGFFSEADIKYIKTRMLLGQTQIVLEHFPVLIANPDLPLPGTDINYTYSIDNTHSIRMLVPISPDVMKWILPTTNNMCIVIEVT